MASLARPQHLCRVGVRDHCPWRVKCTYCNCRGSIRRRVVASEFSPKVGCAKADAVDLQLDIAGRGGDQLRAVPVAQISAGLAPLVSAGADYGGQLILDKPLKRPGKAGADRFGDLPGLDGVEELGQVRVGEGRRRGSSLCKPWHEHAEAHAGGPPNW